MGVINQLDISIANLIAAGEVVDRPASVIKELMENSIDAGATDITVEIKNGGISFMRVTDNGVGMAREDALLCLSRHATSKIKTASDLDGILTLGFRGEALAAISSVAKVRIMTKRREDKSGTLVECYPCQPPEASEAGCKNGTTIIVEELFANVPARRKFLKNDRSEGMAIAAVVEKIALSRPDISIKLIADNNQKMMTTGDKKLYNTIYSLFGRDFAKKTLKVEFTTQGIGVYGYIGQPDNVRPNRNFENFFINQRYIKSKTAAAALEQAFSSYLPSEKFPCCILFINVHPAFVDVNVHPTKLEVKFSDERIVFDAVYCAVKNALISNTDYRPTIFEKDEIPTDATKTYNSFTPVYDRLDSSDKPEQLSVLPTSQQPSDTKKAVDTTPFDEVLTIQNKSTQDMESAMFTPNGQKDDAPARYQGGGLKERTEGNSYGRVERASSSPSRFEIENKTEAETITETIHEAIPETTSETTPTPLSQPTTATETKAIGEKGMQDEVAEGALQYKYLGVVFDTYILVEYNKKMLMIDKHAAHERILFEKMKKNREATRDKYQQMCLVPARLGLSREEFGACQLYRDDIEAVGFIFDLDPMSCSASITAIPGGIENQLAFQLFMEIAGALANGSGSASVAKNIYFEKALYQASCKAAVKGGRYDSEQDMRYIVETLLSNPAIKYCPHGRPVMFEVSQGAIENKFKRT